MECVELSGLPIVDHTDCPLIDQTERYEICPSATIRGPISIVHACGSSCVISYETPLNIERETVTVTSVKTVKHDFKNTLYLLNIYCMNYYSAVQ